MPKIRRSRKQPPDGWELIEPTLEELEQKMREGLLFIFLSISEIHHWKQFEISLFVINF